MARGLETREKLAPLRAAVSDGRCGPAGELTSAGFVRRGRPAPRGEAGGHVARPGGSPALRHYEEPISHRFVDKCSRPSGEASRPPSYVPEVATDPAELSLVACFGSRRVPPATSTAPPPTVPAYPARRLGWWGVAFRHHRRPPFGADPSHAHADLRVTAGYTRASGKRLKGVVESID